MLPSQSVERSLADRQDANGKSFQTSGLTSRIRTIKASRCCIQEKELLKKKYFVAAENAPTYSGCVYMTGKSWSVLHLRDKKT